MGMLDDFILHSANVIVQAASNVVENVFNSTPAPFRPVALAALRISVDASVATMNENDRRAYTHRCRADGRGYKVTFWGPDQDANADDCIYRWNEVNAKDDPAWWQERYDYLRARCPNRRGGVPE